MEIETNEVCAIVSEETTVFELLLYDTAFLQSGQFILYVLNPLPSMGPDRLSTDTEAITQSERRTHTSKHNKHKANQKPIFLMLHHGHWSFSLNDSGKGPRFVGQDSSSNSEQMFGTPTVQPPCFGTEGSFRQAAYVEVRAHTVSMRLQYVALTARLNALAG